MSKRIGSGTFAKWDSDIPIGSVVYLTIDNSDGGVGIVLQKLENNSYRVYRLPPDDDRIVVASYECFVDWAPEGKNS